MKRTQLYLDEDMARQLSSESQRRGTTISELVREAVAHTYGRGRTGGRGDVIRALSGVWKDRADLGSSEMFVRAQRQSSRDRR